MVRDRDHGHPVLAVQPVRDLQHLASSEWIEHGRRFVQHQHARPHGQHARDADALFLPARQQVWRAMSQRLHVHALQRPVHAPHDLVVWQPQVLRAKGHVFFHDGRDDLVVGDLKDHADRRADVAQVRSLARQPVTHEHAPLARRKQRVQVFG